MKLRIPLDPLSLPLCTPHKEQNIKHYLFPLAQNVFWRIFVQKSSFPCEIWAKTLLLLVVRTAVSQGLRCLTTKKKVAKGSVKMYQPNLKVPAMFAAKH
jgi:hypothetical protein